MSARLRFRVAGALAALALAVAAGAAAAACTYPVFDPTYRSAVTSSPEVRRLQGSAMTSHWLVVGTIGGSGEDWDVALYQSQAAEPTCVTGLLASSTWGGDDVDFVVADGVTSAHPDVYARFNRFSGTRSAYAMWTATPITLEVNGAYDVPNIDSTDACRTYETDLTAGVTYSIVFHNTHAPGTRLAIFRNPGTGEYWTGRNGAIATATGTTTFTPTATDRYLIVVTNDAHEKGYYFLYVGTCMAPRALTADVPATASTSRESWSIAQTSYYWSAVAARSPEGCDVTLASGYAGPGYPDCLSGELATSDISSYDEKINFVVGDFNHSPTGTYYVETYRQYGDTNAVVQWASGAHVLTPGAEGVTYTTGPTSLIRTWDIALTAGQTYNFTLAGEGAIVRVLLFRNPGDASYFASRADAVLETRSCATYTAPATDYYGVVVVNDDGAEGSYMLGVTQSPCVCSTQPTSGSAESPVSPDGYYQLAYDPTGWAMVAARGQTTTDDWDLAVYSSPSGSAAPVCFGTAIASSGYGATAVDVVALDYTSSSTHPDRWVRAHHVAATSTTGRLLYRRTSPTLVENDPYVSVHFGPQDLAMSYDATLTAGVTYTIDLQAPVSGLTVLVFQNPGAGLWAGSRSAAAASGTSTFTYTPTLSGHHGIVVVNDGIVDVTWGLRFGRCATPAPLANRTLTETEHGQETYSLTAPNASWFAAGVRANAADWDLRIGTSLGTSWPSCAANVLANSTNGSTWFTDFVVSDFHHATTGGSYVLNAQQYTSTPLRSTYTWLDQGGGSIVANAAGGQSFSFARGEIVKAFDLALNAGETYTFSMQPYTPSFPSNSHLLLFRNTGSGAYWAGRSSAVLDLANGATSVTYTAPATDVYGVVIADDGNGGDQGAVTTSVRSCPGTVALANNGVQTTPVAGWYTFAPIVHYWTAVGVRSTSPWIMEVDSLGTGGAPGVCFSTSLATSTAVSKVSFVVGDMNTGANPLHTYYARAAGYAQSGMAAGTVQWTGTSQSLGVNSAPTARTATASRVLETWDVYLYAGAPYQLWLDNKGAATLKACVFANPTGGSCWLPRSSALVETATSATFTAPRTGWYAVVVANDDGGAGAYTIGVYGGALGADTAPPAVTALRNVAPNPAAGAFTVEFALHDAASVMLEVLDMAGRRMATLADGPRDAGTWRVPFESARAASGSLRPGVYFVRLQADGRTIGEKKLVLLR